MTLYWNKAIGCFDKMSNQIKFYREVGQMTLIWPKGNFWLILDSKQRKRIQKNYSYLFYNCNQTIEIQNNRQGQILDHE